MMTFSPMARRSIVEWQDPLLSGGGRHGAILSGAVVGVRRHVRLEGGHATQICGHAIQSCGDAARVARAGFRLLTPALVVLVAITSVGCGPSYVQLRKEGYRAMNGGAYGPARILFEQADKRHARQVENYHDMGACSVMIAREKFEQMNEAAASRELERAIDYYSEAIEIHPGHQASLEGKSAALEMKGQFEAALKHAEWTAEFVGPSAKQFLFLAREYEERGDVDGAFTRYRQAVTVQPKNAQAHAAFARFLMKNNNERAAVQHLRVAYQLNPRDPWVEQQLDRRGMLVSSEETRRRTAP